MTEAIYDFPRLRKVLFAVEGYTDIRFVTGLSEIFDLTLMVPANQYRESGLKQRMHELGLQVPVVEIPGGKFRYQIAAFRYLLKNIGQFELVLSQEVLRGSLNASAAGRIRGVPVLCYLCIAPVEYFRCRRRRGLNLFAALLGESLIRFLLAANSRIARGCIALGPYLNDVARRSFRNVVEGYYYGVDVSLYRPVSEITRNDIRRRLGFDGRFVIFLPSRISHEKDPETVLRAVSIARGRGLDAVVINLGGGYREFLALAEAMNLPERERWVLGYPAVHPMNGLEQYYQSADCMALASLAEGLGMSPLESLSCGTPAVCTAVGGMARILPGYARLVPAGDAEAMAEQFLWIAANPAQAREQALRGRAFVEREWSRTRSFLELRRAAETVCAPLSGVGNTPSVEASQP